MGLVDCFLSWIPMDVWMFEVCLGVEVGDGRTDFSFEDPSSHLQQYAGHACAAVLSHRQSRGCEVPTPRILFGRNWCYGPDAWVVLKRSLSYRPHSYEQDDTIYSRTFPETKCIYSHKTSHDFNDSKHTNQTGTDLRLGVNSYHHHGRHSTIPGLAANSSALQTRCVKGHQGTATSRLSAITSLKDRSPRAPTPKTHHHPHKNSTRSSRMSNLRRSIHIHRSSTPPRNVLSSQPRCNLPPLKVREEACLPRTMSGELARN